MHKFNIKNIEKLDNPDRRKMMPPEETLLKFGIQNDGNLLDVGCGIGYFTIPAARFLKNHKVTGIDISQEIIDIARERAEGLNNIEFIKSQEYSFPLENGSMKYILISNVIHEVEDKAEYFKEIRRVLQADGFVLIIDWEKKEMEMGPPLHERISKDEMIILGKQFGLKLSEDINVSEYHYGIKLQKNADI